MSVVAALGSLLDSAHPIDERPLSLFQGSSSTYKKYAPTATTAAAATPNVDDTCDALLEPDAEADAADPFSELDELDVVEVPEEDESSVEEDAVVDDDEPVVVVLDEPVVVALEPAVLDAVVEVAPLPVDPAVDVPVVVSVLVPDAAVDAPVVDAPVAVVAAPVLDAAVEAATEVPVAPVVVVVAPAV
ncbi:hypothetical protein PRIC2_014010 [Phytophthora ramorum]